MHIWVAKRFCDVYEIPAEEVKELLVGTEFPDIHYITPLSRQSTHPIVSDIQDIYDSSTPFEKGMKLHAWLDVVREAFISPQVYEAVGLYSEGFSATLLKFIEEEIFSDFYDPGRWSFCFDISHLAELAITSEESIVKWHEILKWTFAVRPSWLLWMQSYKGAAFGVPADVLYRWSYLLPKLKDEPLFRSHCMRLLEHVSQELRRKESF